MPADILKATQLEAPNLKEQAEQYDVAAVAAEGSNHGGAVGSRRAVAVAVAVAAAASGDCGKGGQWSRRPCPLLPLLQAVVAAAETGAKLGGSSSRSRSSNKHSCSCGSRSGDTAWCLAILVQHLPVRRARAYRHGLDAKIMLSVF